MTILLGIIAGGISYLVVNFWMNPLLRYLDIKHQVTSDLVFYANVIDTDGLNDEMQERRKNRREKNRKHAAEIRACYYRLPNWYRWYLKITGEDPVSASKNLIGLSNSSKEENGEKHITRLRRALKIPESIEE